MDVNEYLEMRGRAEMRERERARRRRRGSATAVAVIVTFTLLTGIFGIPKIAGLNLKPGTIPIPEPALSGKVSIESDLSINSRAAALLDVKTGKIIFDKNSTAKIYPASLTKVMTAIVAIERIEDLNTRIVLNEPMFYPLYTKNAATAGFSPGDSVTALDLLYGLLLTSGAECAAGLAEFVAGSEIAFAEIMNDKAQKIGMKGTHFTNATGLHDETLYSTAEDMAALFTYALNDDTFFEIITSESYITDPTNTHPEGIRLSSTLFSNMTGALFPDGRILGGKTGYTYEAGQCLASFAVKEGKIFVLVTAGAAGENGTHNLHIDDAFRIYGAIK